jgi:DNA polymerase delta subunit 2
MVVAAKGKSLGGGEFEVFDIIFPGYAPPRVPIIPTAPESVYVALASGFKIGGIQQSPLALQLFVDYLIGILGGDRDEEDSSKIVQVIIAGNLLAPAVFTKEEFKSSISGRKVRATSSQLISLRECDLALSILAQHLPVTVMPGYCDPTNYTLPQQPLNPCLFPIASKYVNFVSTPNPHQFQINGRR